MRFSYFLVTALSTVALAAPISSQGSGDALIAVTAKRSPDRNGTEYERPGAETSSEEKRDRNGTEYERPGATEGSSEKKRDRNGTEYERPGATEGSSEKKRDRNGTEYERPGAETPEDS